MSDSQLGGRVLVVGNEPWWIRSIKSILEGSSYSVHATSSGGREIRTLQLILHDAAVIHVHPANRQEIDLVRHVRSAGLCAECPVVLISEEPLRREERLEALRAGAWDCLTIPFDGEELLLKLEFYLAARRAVHQAREQVLLDEASGLYNFHGILRLAQELAHSARRYHRALGCAVFAPVRAPAAGGDADETPDGDEVARQIAEQLTGHGRTSDVVGRLSRDEYVVLAPETGPDGIVTMANRLLSVLPGSVYSFPQPALRLHAGCYAVSDLTSEPVEPAEIIARATLALRQARKSDTSALVQFFRSSPSTPALD